MTATFPGFNWAPTWSVEQQFSQIYAMIKDKAERTWRLITQAESCVNCLYKNQSSDQMPCRNCIRNLLAAASFSLFVPWRSSCPALKAWQEMFPEINYRTQGVTCDGVYFNARIYL